MAQLRALCDDSTWMPTVLIVDDHPSRDGSDFEPLVASSGAWGFVPKNELSGAAISALIRRGNRRLAVW
jgi:hypothetical protein